MSTGSRMSRTSVDLPDPDTPVTATKFPSGMSTSMFCRLCSRAPSIRTNSSPCGRRTSGTGIDLRPDRYCPVIDSLTFRIPGTLPE